MRTSPHSGDSHVPEKFAAPCRVTVLLVLYDEFAVLDFVLVVVRMFVLPLLRVVVEVVRVVDDVLLVRGCASAI
jgi:hypothetical protein